MRIQLVYVCTTSDARTCTHVTLLAHHVAGLVDLDQIGQVVAPVVHVKEDALHQLLVRVGRILHQNINTIHVKAYIRMQGSRAKT